MRCGSGSVTRPSASNRALPPQPGPARVVMLRLVSRCKARCARGRRRFELARATPAPEAERARVGDYGSGTTDFKRYTLNTMCSSIVWAEKVAMHNVVYDKHEWTCRRFSSAEIAHAQCFVLPPEMRAHHQAKGGRSRGDLRVFPRPRFLVVASERRASRLDAPRAGSAQVPSNLWSPRVARPACPLGPT